MKKITILMAMLNIFLLGALVLAAPVPRPIAVKVLADTAVISGIDVRITDVNLNIARTYTTNEYGEIVIDASDFAGFRDADTFQVVVLVCSSSPVCTQSNVLGNAVIFTFDLKGIYTPSPTCPTCESLGYILPNNCPSCPVCLDCPTCSDCPTCEECQTCPTTNWYEQIETIISVIVALAVGAGVGFRVTKYGTKSHFHPGIISYHSPDTMHKAPYTHNKGEVFPKYEKDANGKWKYVGG